MTCIIGLEYHKKVYMGCDGIVMSGDVKSPSHRPKVFREKNTGMLMGFSGLVEVAETVQYDFVPPAQQPKVSDPAYLRVCVSEVLRDVFERNKISKDSLEQSVIMLAHRGHLYCANAYQLSFFRSLRGYDASGSGSEIALGAMWATRASGLSPRERIKVGLKAASEFISSVGPPFTILES